MADDAAAEALEAFGERFVDALLGSFLVHSIYIGDQLGFYVALADGGPTTSVQLAEAASTDERMTREWLEQQTVAGVLTVDDESASPTERRYGLPPGHDIALAETDNVDFMAPFAQLFVGAASPTEALLEAYRNGAGVPYADYGSDLVHGQGRANRNLCLQTLGQEWLPSISDVHSRLQQPGATVADVGCGVGWSTIGIARAYPDATVTGFDLDQASFREARTNIDNSDVADRADIHLRDAGDLEFADQFDLVIALECLHDMADPVTVLQAMRSAAKPDGAVLIIDERVGHAFTAAGAELEEMMYGWSILHCLPVGMTERPTEATGTVMRPPTLENYAGRAGYSSVEILPIENDFFYVYRLHL
jgi:2-polyprenyl-3-methyl-5-hydroxy-6-metoxy-1,4-benzoquinol methylase